MNNKQVMTITFVSLLLFSALAGLQLVDLAWANLMIGIKPGYATISIHSPQEKTYNVNAVPLNFIVITNMWCDYYSFSSVLDRQAAVKIERVNVTGKVTIRDDYPYDPYTEYTLEGSAVLPNLSDGWHNITVYFGGEPYYEPFSDTVSFNVDASPPKISILSVKNETYDTTDILLSFTMDESVSWMCYSLDSQCNVTITGNTTLTGLSNGCHTLTVYAKDTAGNIGASETVNFTVAIEAEPPPEPQPLEPFPTWIVAAIVIVAVVGAALLVYFRRIKKSKRELGEPHV